MMTRMGIYTRLASMEIATGKPRLTRLVSLTRLRRLIRRQGWGLGRPNPNRRQIILNMMARLTRMTGVPRLSRVTRLPRQSRLTRLTSITSLTRQTILARLEVLDRRTRLTRMVSLPRRNRLIRGSGRG